MQGYEKNLVNALVRERAYPHDPGGGGGVEHVQTHLSHVFLTRDRVYKLRKPVVFGFVDFGTTRARNADCWREVELNRRLAPDVYLGVAPVRMVASRAEVGEIVSSAEECDPFSLEEHVVVMRRLPAARDALSLLAQGKLSPEMLDCVAQRIASFHAEQNLGKPAPFRPLDWKRSIIEPVCDNLRVLGATCSDSVLGEIGACRQMTRRFESVHGDRLERRRLEGRAVDGHGDLHLQHLWFEREDDPVIIDCLEFSDDLRRIDAAADVAFLLMDLRYRGRSDLARRFARKYAAFSDDYDMYGVLDYFVSYRAAVRAKVASLACRDSALPAEQRARADESVAAHVALARRALETRSPGSLIALCGTIGTGKSSVAEELAEILPGVPIASDRVRKHMAGLAAHERTGAGLDEGLYRPEAREAVYAALLQRAKAVLDAGRTAILDARYALRSQRDALREWAENEGVDVVLVEAVCAPETVRQRLERRAASPCEPSDAGPQLLGVADADHQAPDEWPEALRHRVDTGDPDWRTRLRADASSFFSNRSFDRHP